MQLANINDFISLQVIAMRIQLTGHKTDNPLDLGIWAE